MSGKLVVGLIGALWLLPASAYWTGQDLTEAEWASWSDFCKASYLVSEWSAGSRFSGRLSSESRAKILEGNTIPGAHHFCIALVAMDRAKSKSGEQFKQLMMKAVTEIDYNRRQMSSAKPKYAYVSAYYAKALYGTGEKVQAFRVWDEAITISPTEREAYLLKTQALISEKRFKDALETLQAFDKAKDQEWADAEYFHGYVHYQLKRYGDAARHLDKAVSLGYPHTGLRDKARALANKE